MHCIAATPRHSRVLARRARGLARTQTGDAADRDDKKTDEEEI